MMLSPVAAALRSHSRQPNVLFVVADEWRGQALPCAGDRDLIAPNLVRLAREGVYFRRAYTSYAVCCPARAAMLTGKFPHAAGVTHNHTLLPLDQGTMSAELKRAGYRTGYIGKWHLDGAESPGFVPPSRRRGFDYWAAYNVAHQHYDSVYFRDTPEPIRPGGFEPDYQTRLAIDFIREQGNEPFFLYLSFVPPHPPLTPPPRYAMYDPSRMHVRPNVPEDRRAEAQKLAAGYYGLCTAIDENLGKLMAELDRRRLTEETILVFTSDHGGMFGSHGLDAIDLPYEESSNIPLLIRYPNWLKRGIVSDALISNVDYAPTLLSLCGVKPLPGMQGVNLAPWLTGGHGRPPESIYSEGSVGQPDEWRMVVHGTDKLVVNSKLAATHLYNLRRDPYELKNLAADPSERRRQDELMTLLRLWISRTSDRVPFSPLRE